MKNGISMTPELLHAIESLKIYGGVSEQEDNGRAFTKYIGCETNLLNCYEKKQTQCGVSLFNQL